MGAIAAEAHEYLFSAPGTLRFSPLVLSPREEGILHPSPFNLSAQRRSNTNCMRGLAELGSTARSKSVQETIRFRRI